MHENDENMLFWSQFKFWITFHLQFLVILFIILANNWYKNKEKQFFFISTLFYNYYQIIRIVYFCVKTEKEPFYCISWKFYAKKIEK